MGDPLVDVSAEHEALLQFLYLAPVGLAQIAPDGEILMINPISAQLLMPLSRDGGLNNLFTALQDIAPDLRHTVAGFAPDSGLICDALRLQLDAGVRGKSDPRFLSLSLLKLDDERVMAVLGDVTQQVKREKLLRQSQAWFNAICTGISDYALICLDRRGRVVDWNESIGRVTGFGRDAVVGEPYSMFYSVGSITADRVLDRLREADEDGWSLDDGWRARADGSRYWGSAMIAPLRERHGASAAGDDLPSSDGEPCYSLVIRDITDKREAGEQLRQHTGCDHLTGVANRRTFFEAAEVELARWQRAPRHLSLLLLDADHFKAINDRHGHPAGDAVLRDLAATLTDSFRDVDVVARVGGEEFAVLMLSTPLDRATDLAERLLARLADRVVEVDGVRLRYTVSGGIAAMADGVSGLDELMKRADQALYAAKNAGRNRVACWPTARPVTATMP